MARLYQVILALLLILSVAFARPATESAVPNDLESVDPANIEAAAQTPQVYLIIAESLDEPSKFLAAPLGDDDVVKRSAEEVDDLETAAGTNVLRPLFVYRQQLAYRDRVKKGAIRRSTGFRPRFE